MASKVKDELIKMYVECLQQGQLPWTKGMKHLKMARNLQSGRRYTGMNAMILAYIAQKRGYKGSRWMTFTQIDNYRKEHGITGSFFNVPAKGAGVPVRCWGMKIYDKEKGEWSSKVYPIPKVKEMIKLGKIEESQLKIVPLSDIYVFNEDIINGVIPEPERQVDPVEQEEKVQFLIDEMKVGYEERSVPSAYYSPSEDLVVVPSINEFNDAQYYISTQLHELSHATGAKHRLNRESLINSDGFGGEIYAKEELAVEIAASFICSAMGVETDEKHDLNHAAYIQSWISLFENDPKVLDEAISTAETIEKYVVDIVDRAPNRSKELDWDISDKNKIERGDEIGR